MFKVILKALSTASACWDTLAHILWEYVRLCHVSRKNAARHGGAVSDSRPAFQASLARPAFVYFLAAALMVVQCCYRGGCRGRGRRDGRRRAGEDWTEVPPEGRGQGNPGAYVPMFSNPVGRSHSRPAPLLFLLLLQTTSCFCNFSFL